MPTNSGKKADRRQSILEAGLAVLREEGLQGFTQPRIAARVGLRQSHLTYYYATRIDLLAAVAQVAIARQLAAAQQLSERAGSPTRAAAVIASIVAQHENTRVLVALNQAADHEAELRTLFNQLTDGFVQHLSILATKIGIEPSQPTVDLIHALFVGLSVIELATGRPNGEARSRKVLETAFALLPAAQSQPSRGAKPAKNKGK